MASDMHWLNEPPSWSERDGTLSVRTGDRTDFWRETFYGFIRDDGHFRYRMVEGDFSAEVTFAGRYQKLYDQAGLMVRVDERNWIKTGVEYTDGAQHFSVVVTRGQSDWSVLNLEGEPAEVSVRLTRHDTAFRVQFRAGSAAWRMARLAYLPAGTSVAVGPMCCSPQRAGFEVGFAGFRVGPPISRELHE